MGRPCRRRGQRAAQGGLPGHSVSFDLAGAAEHRSLRSLRDEQTDRGQPCRGDGRDYRRGPDRFFIAARAQ
ncbi:MAG: hypothetical protein DME25_11470, partial [Verrucomicrobia bacterium]